MNRRREGSPGPYSDERDRWGYGRGAATPRAKNRKCCAPHPGPMVHMHSRELAAILGMMDHEGELAKQEVHGCVQAGFLLDEKSHKAIA